VAESNDSAQERMYPSCPCCQFFVPDDLFLPTSDYDPGNDQVLSEMIKPPEAWEKLQRFAHTLLQTGKDDRHANDDERGNVLLVDSHGHAHLEPPSQGESIYTLGSGDDDDTGTNSLDNMVASLTCAVCPEDWGSCLEYASKSKHRVAAIGVHPWYLDNLPDTWLTDLETLLQKHQGCMVGEMGLCKQARFLRTYEGGKQEALKMQRDVFVQQLHLAGKYHRAVSVHCVNQQGVLLDILKELETNMLPTAIALHSFTGTAHHVQQLLKWEATLRRSEPLLYFGFSHIVNYGMCSSDKSRRQGRLAVQSVPRDRLLAESDVHSNADVLGGTVGAVAYISWALQGVDSKGADSTSLEAIAALTRRNGLRFLNLIRKTAA